MKTEIETADALLERVDRICWSAPRCLHGTAAHVPAAVRGLLSHDVRVVERASSNLENSVVAQNTLYEAGLHLPEILIDALDFAAHPAGVLNLLVLLGNATPSDAPTPCPCRPTVIRGLEKWLERAATDHPLRSAVEEDLRELR